MTDLVVVILVPVSIFLFWWALTATLALKERKPVLLINRGCVSYVQIFQLETRFVVVPIDGKPSEQVELL